ncbi:MAG TPA: 4-hydroxybenzoate octaprenyltransferase [Parvularculaceae bacterium]|nr:4-hydroxybenzoate octaprenyltransferase [Parvularculaceae bacterium]
MNSAFQADAPADADAKNWVDRYAPPPAKPYLRLMRADRPIGTWLLLIPCWQGLALAAAERRGFSDWPQLLAFALLFAVGAFVMRGAGCAYNDIVDKDFDAKVARTAMRPIPSGQISLGAAWAFLVALCLIGLAILLQFNPFTIYLGFGSLALVALYPFMKRFTWWPQAWLGLAFNWGALMGFSAVAGGLGLASWALYAAGLAWTLGYDTIYAHQDKEDDALIGVKSSARRLGNATKPALVVFYAATIALVALAGALARANPLFYVALLPAAAHFAWQILRLDINDAARCLAVFKSNREAGLLILAALLSIQALPALPPR